MDKYRLLITGKNKAVIDDFFNHTGNEFETVSTSDRMDDINRHLDFFKPQVMVLALYDESRDDIFKFTELKRRLAKEEIVLVIIGEKEDCDIFEKVTFHMADYIIHRPVDVSEIRNRIVNYLEEIEKQKEEDREIQLALEALREQQRRKHVLVIDDDPLMLKLIKEYLHENYDVATAVSGKIAYKFLENKTTDLILLDYEMPVENGPMVLETLRQNSELANIPVVFLTGISDKEKIKQALMLKPQGYLLKPIDRETLLGTIEKFLG